MWSTVLAVYRVKLITWSQRAKTFEISRKLTKFRLNWGTNILIGYKFCSKTDLQEFDHGKLLNWVAFWGTNLIIF